MTAKRSTCGIILCALALFCLCTLARGEEGKKQLTNADVQRIAAERAVVARDQSFFFSLSVFFLLRAIKKAMPTDG